MSSGAQQAIFNFPPSVDVYSTKVDYGAVISAEAHVVPASAPYALYLNYIPLSGTISIPGFSEVFSSPGSNQYQVTYTGANAGYTLFNGTNSSVPIVVSYTSAGDIARAFYFNNLQQSVTTIENFIGSGLGITGTFLQLTGGTMVGNIVLNGSNIVPVASGNGNIGTAALPFSTMAANSIIAGSLSEATSTALIDLDPGLVVISSTNAITGTATNSVTLTGGNSTLTLSNGLVAINAPSSQLSILATGTNVAGSVLPSITSVYNLGSPSHRWGTVYASNLDTTSLSSQFVAVTGDSMTGNLLLLGPATVQTNNLTNADTPNLSISAPGSLGLSSANVNIGGASTVNITAPNMNVGPMNMTSSQVTVGATVQPNVAASYDLGSPANPFRNVYAGNVVGANFSGNFVSKSGDSMSGDLVMNNFGTGTTPTIWVQNLNALSGGGIMNMTMGQLSVLAQNNVAFFMGPSGIQAFQITPSNIYFSQSMIPGTGHTFDLGGPSNYIRNVYADNITASSLGSGSTINGAIIQNPQLSGNLAALSGATIGSSGNPLSTLYVSNIVSNVSTGVYVSKAGDSMTGNLTMTGTANILTANSGTTNIGSVSSPFGTIYANNIVSTGSSAQYVLKAGDTMTGILNVPQIQYTGNLNLSGTVSVNTYAGQILDQAQQITLTTAGGGAIIVNGQTQTQLLNNGVLKSVITASGTDLYDNIWPNTSGTLSVGTATNPFHAIYADNIIPTNVSGVGLYVLKVGDTMVGTLNFSSGVGIQLLQSGTSNVGSVASPLNAIYANNYYGAGGASLLGAYVATTGGTMTGNLNFSGGNITATGNLTISNGFPGDIAVNAVGNLFLTAGNGGIYFTGNSFTASPAGPVIIGGGAGSVEILGGMYGVFVTGNNGPISLTTTLQPMTFTAQNGFLIDTSSTSLDPVIKMSNNPATYLDIVGNTKFSGNAVPNGSGVYALGSASLPFTGVYAKTINGQVASIKVYNEIPSGSANGINAQFYTAYLPVSGTAQLYRAGLRQTPGGVDYTISGSGITFTVAPVSGNNILVDYERPIF